MIHRIEAVANSGHQPVSLRCPGCRQQGVFETLGVNDIMSGQYTFGHRRCPNPACWTHVFFVRGPEGTSSYPTERLDFDATNVPQAVAAAFEEAVSCHANQCFIASAMMVRKTLEELCADRGAKGDNLQERIKALGNVVVLPKELLQGVDDLRLLGNAAAHIESREYANVGREEVEVGIEFTKEVLKAVYQYSALLGRLRALKKAP
jgi:hypothetical protein